MNDPKAQIIEIVNLHVSRLMKNTVYGQLSEIVSETTVDRLRDELLAALTDTLRRDQRINVALETNELFTRAGKLNGLGIYHAILQAANVNQDPVRTKLNHLAKNAEIVFRSARLLKEDS